MALLIYDPDLEARVRALRPEREEDPWIEVWEGMTVVSPNANNEHQKIVFGLGAAFYMLIDREGRGEAFGPINLSDRSPDWGENYRIPDLAVFLKGTTAVNHETYWVGGPDLVVEVISRGENPTAKFAFYESVNTREVLIIDRDPWAVTLYALVAGKLTPVPSGASALGMRFDLVPGTARAAGEGTRHRQRPRVGGDGDATLR